MIIIRNTTIGSISTSTTSTMMPMMTPLIMTITTTHAVEPRETDKALRACPPKLAERRRKILEKIGA